MLNSFSGRGLSFAPALFKDARSCCRRQTEVSFRSFIFVRKMLGYDDDRGIELIFLCVAKDR